MLRLCSFARFVLVMSVVAFAQSVAEADEVDDFVREIRESTDPTRAKSHRIEVYATHYVVDGEKLASPDDVRTRVKEFPPGTFAIAIRECGAGARREELGEMLRELTQEYVREVQDRGYSRPTLFSGIESWSSACRPGESELAPQRESE